jgi:hypothetical protein
MKGCLVDLKLKLLKKRTSLKTLWQTFHVIWIQSCCFPPFQNLKEQPKPFLKKLDLDCVKYKLTIITNAAFTIKFSLSLLLLLQVKRSLRIILWKKNLCSHRHTDYDGFFQPTQLFYVRVSHTHRSWFQFLELHISGFSVLSLSFFFICIQLKITFRRFGVKQQL